MSAPAEVERAEVRVARESVVRELLPVARLVRVYVRGDTESGRRLESSCGDADSLGACGLPKEARTTVGAEAAASISIAVGAVDPAERRGLADDEVVDPRRRERPDVPAHPPHSEQWPKTMS